MFQLLTPQREQIAKLVVSDNDKSAFMEWLDFILDKVLKAERRNIEIQYEGYFKQRIANGTDIPVYKATKGQFEMMIEAVWNCTAASNRCGASNLANALLGMMWEWQFCNLLANDRIRVHWFQKWEPFGAPRFAWGWDIPVSGIPTPDLMFIVNKNWVFAEVKHVFPVDNKYTWADWDNILKTKPKISLLLVVHKSQPSNKWNPASKEQDWVAYKVKKTSSSQHVKVNNPTTWTKDADRYNLSCDLFEPLADALAKLT